MVRRRHSCHISAGLATAALSLMTIKLLDAVVDWNTAALPFADCVDTEASGVHKADTVGCLRSCAAAHTR